FEARYRDLITRAPSIVCEVQPNGTITLINDAVRALLGWDPGELDGKNLWQTLCENGDRRHIEDFLRVVRKRDVTGYEVPLRAKDGRRRWIAWNSANRYRDDGALLALVLFG